jgi:hypothetical protein
MELLNIEVLDAEALARLENPAPAPEPPWLPTVKILLDAVRKSGIRGMRPDDVRALARLFRTGIAEDFFVGEEAGRFGLQYLTYYGDDGTVFWLPEGTTESEAEAYLKKAMNVWEALDGAVYDRMVALGYDPETAEKAA